MTQEDLTVGEDVIDVPGILALQVLTWSVRSSMLPYTGGAVALDVYVGGRAELRSTSELRFGENLVRITCGWPW